MKRYSSERKESVLRKMLPPLNKTIHELESEEGIPRTTLYDWRIQARNRGVMMPSSGNNPQKGDGAVKFRVVLETAALNEAELSAYCREKGIYPSDVKEWQEVCAMANTSDKAQRKAIRDARQADAKRIRELERELRRKDKALAETAALLVLRKKAVALWGEEES
jgi:hypothetical protein